MKIARMTKGAWGKVRAFFDLETSEGLTIKNFKIIDGSNGLFVSMPSEKNKEGKYEDKVFCNKQLRQELNKLATDYYNSQENSKDDFPF